jgi:cysteine desulfurase/selenocysteine lyase
MAIKRDFPVFSERPGLVYLDSAASSQKPSVVLEALDDFYRRHYANVHRGIYQLSEEATRAYEGARAQVAAFFGAGAADLVFTRNATEAINLVGRTWGDLLEPGDQILVTVMEHHSNLIPWQQLAGRKGASIVWADIDDQGRLDLEGIARLLEAGGVRLVAVTQMSNVLGTVNPISWIAEQAHRAGALLLVDGAQSAAHLPLNLASLGADFFAFSGHKLGGPSGIGGLIARPGLLEEMPPFLGGGEMIREVWLDRATFADPPQRFEAGTPAIAEAVALARAVTYLDTLGIAELWKAERQLTERLLDGLDALGLPCFGPRGEDRAGVASFNLPGIHAHDLASFLDLRGIAVRAGHHCAQPLMRRLGQAATARASLFAYSDAADVDALLSALAEAKAFFA